jgi:acetylornithine/N-succinyldiaminopimelate aminotransferase
MTVTEARQTTSAQQRWGQVMMDNYGTPPLAIRSASGVRVVDFDGREYLDFVGGIAVSALGHCHPALVKAITTQASTLMHTSNLLIHEPGLQLAERLTAFMQDDTARVFFCNDGATANECAIKIARLHGRQSDPSGKRMTLVSTENSFHGRTMGALSITGNASKREPFEPLPGPVKFVPYGDVDALRYRPCSSSRRRARAASCRHRPVISKQPGRSATKRARSW